MNIKTLVQKSKILLAAFAVVLTPALAVQAVSAQSIFDSAKGEACKGANAALRSGQCGDNQSEKLDTTIKNIVNILSVIVGIAAVITIIVTGLRFITSGGDANTISSAKNGILYAVVGLVVVALSQVIVRFVLDKA